MPAQVNRLKQRFLGGVSFAGVGRFYKEIYINPRDFQGFDGANASATCTVPGSAAGGSLLVAFGACALPWVSGSLAKIQTVVQGGASVASPTTISAYVPRPQDADTTGSIICLIDWTYGDAAAAGSRLTMFAGLGYVGNGSAIPRTAASLGSACSASYGQAACGLYETACLGKFPSFGANDRAVVFALAWGGASAAGGQGQMNSACVHILGARLRYLSNAHGASSPE